MLSPGAVNPREATHPSKHPRSPCQSLSCNWRPRSGTQKLSGDSTAAIPIRNHEIQSRPGGPLTVPTPASRTGAAGASGPVSEVGDQPLQRCPGIRIRPPRPPPGLTAPAASCSSAGRSARPAPPRPPGSAAASRAEQTPCFCFQSETPPRGGARDSARRDPLASSMELEKSPCSQPPFPASLSCLCSS